MSLQDCIVNLGISPEDAATFQQFVDEHAGDEQAGVQAFIDILAQEEQEVRSALAAAGFVSDLQIEPGQLLYQDPVDSLPVDPALTATPHPLSLDALSSLEATFKYAMSNSFGTNRELKLALDERVRAEAERLGIDLTDDSPETVAYLVRISTADALYAMKDNANAVGWYDEKVSHALRVMSLIHPELATDENARFRFIWGLAVTSNGLKVDKNFELAEQVYRRSKKTGRFPTDLEAGQAQAAINEGLGHYNRMKAEWGEDDLRKFMISHFTATQAQRISGVKVDGEAGGSTVRGAAILGPKIGNGFFSNLYGYFDALTMDRWLMRTWGRWTGSLIQLNEAQVAEKSEDLIVTLGAVMSNPQNVAAIEAIATQRDVAYKQKFDKDNNPIPIPAPNPKSIPDLAVVQENLPALAAWFQRNILIKKKKRDEFNKLTLGNLTGNEMRLYINRYTLYADGQVEAPSGGPQRELIRRVFRHTLTSLQNEHGHTNMTMADLQALVWYPEKLLYDQAKSTEDAQESYDDEEAPDYANAADKLAASRGVAKSKIRAAKADGLRAIRSGHGAEAQRATIPERQTLNQSERKRFLARRAIHRLRSNRERNAASSSPYQRDGGGDGKRIRLLRKDVIAVHTLPKERKADFKLGGISTQDMYEVPGELFAGDFKAAIEASKAGSKFGAAVYVYSEAEYQTMRIFRTKDGKAGFAIKDGRDIVSVYSGAEHAGLAHGMMELAVQQGGRTLDAFDTVLVDLYSMHGFKINARMKWNDKYTPDGWDKKTFQDFTNGEPDVVYMSLDVEYKGQPSATDGVYVTSEEEADQINVQAVNVPLGPLTLEQSAPASRRDMHYTDVTTPIPELTAAAKMLNGGGMTRQEYAGLVNKHKPVTPYDEAPRATTKAGALNALKDPQKSKWKAPRDLEPGAHVGLRLDIPAYRDFGAWVVSVHRAVLDGSFKAGKVIGYDSAARITGVKFGVHANNTTGVTTALPIARREIGKSTIATMQGSYVHTGVEETRRLAKEAMTDPAWVQVGMDPERHSFFYGRDSQKPIISADEVIQVGPLVMAKNPVYDKADKYLYQDASGPRGAFSQEGLTYGNIRNIITLTDGADVSTFLHEMSHFWAKFNQQALADPDLTDAGRAQLEDMNKNTRAWMKRNAKSAWKDIQDMAKSARAVADANPGDSSALARANRLEGAVKYARENGGVAKMEQVAEAFMQGNTTVWQQTLEVAFHEQFARGMEKWYFEGTAPTAGLRSTFTKFSHWWTGVYPSLDALNAEIDPQIKGVYARITASEEALNQEHADLEYLIPPEVRNAATDDEVEELLRLAEAARLEASAVINERVARRLLVERKKERSDRKEEVTKEVTEETRRNPLYAALNLIKDGTNAEGVQYKDTAGNPVAYKISKEEYIARYGKEAADRVKKSVWSTKSHPALANMDEVAALAGYDSADAMANGLASGAPSQQEVIRTLVDQILTEEFGATLTADQLSDDAEDALLNDDHIKQVALQARILERLAKPAMDKIAQRVAEQEGAPDDASVDREAVEDAELQVDRNPDDPRDAAPATLRVAQARSQRVANQSARRGQRAAHATVRNLERSLDLEAIKQAAAAHIEGQRVHKVTPGKYRAAADRLNVKIQREVASRNYDTALGLMQQRLLNIQLAREADRVNNLVKKKVRALKNQLNEADKKSKAFENNFLNALRMAVGPLGLSREVKANMPAEAALNKLEDVDPAGYQDLVDIANNITASGASLIAEAESLGLDAYQLMSVGEFLGMMDMASMFLANSRDANAITFNGQRLLHSEIGEQIAEETIHRGKDETPAMTKRGTKLQRWSRAAFGSVNAYTRRVESWAKMMDNGKFDGPLTTYFVRPVLDAVTAYKSARAAPLQALVDALQPVHGTLSQHRVIEAPELGALGHSFSTKGELIAAMTHTGNASNLRKLLLGGQKDFRSKKANAWAEETVDEETGERTLETASWDAFMQRMEKEGVITRADWDLVQSLWDILDTTLPAAQQAHFKMYGYYFKEVPAQEVRTSFGIMRGGYVPAIADPTMHPESQQHIDADTLAKQQNSSTFPGGEDGFTKSRTEITRALNLELSMLPAHLDSVLKFSHIAPAVRQAALLLKSKPVSEAINRVDSSILAQALIPWLQRTVNQQTTTPTGARQVDRFFTALNRNVGMNAMAANFVNAAQQVTGLSTALSVIEMKYLMQSKMMLKDGDTTREFITKMSPYMQNRMVDSVRELTDNIDQILVDDNPFRRTQAFASKYSYFAQQLVQNQMDSIVWMGAWAQAKKEGGVWQQIYEANLQELGDTAAAAKADQGAAYYSDSLVRDTQTPMEAQDISRIEAGTAFMRLFTKFYSYFNNQRNLIHTQADLALQGVGWQGKAGRMFHLYLVTVFIPSVVAQMFSMAARGELDDWDDEERLPGMLAELLLGSQVDFVANFIPAMGGLSRRIRGEFTPEVYDDRLSFSPVIGSIENMIRAGSTIGELVVDHEGVDGPKALRALLTSVAITTGIPLNWFIKPATWMLKVEAGDQPAKDITDIVEGALSGRSSDK